MEGEIISLETAKKIEYLEKENSELKRNNKRLKSNEEFLCGCITKALDYIENDLQSFLYSIEYNTLINILKGVDKSWVKKQK